MPLKSKVLIWGVRTSCVANLIAALAVFGVCIFFLESDDRAISVPIIETWKELLMKIGCLSGLASSLSCVWFWASTKYKRGDRAVVTCVLLSLSILVFAGLFFTAEAIFLNQTKQFRQDAIFNATKTSISSGIRETGNKMWSPPWLTSIQEQSKTCCGIRTFNDWNDFWKPIQNHVPTSCCRSAPEKCQTDLSTIPFPDTAASFIKVENGCFHEIVTRIEVLLLQSLILSLVLTVHLVVTIILFLILYACLIFKKSPKDDEDQDSGPNLLNEDQTTWATLDFFPPRSSSNIGKFVNTRDESSGAIVDMENKAASTDEIVQVDFPAIPRTTVQDFQITSPQPLPAQIQYIDIPVNTLVQGSTSASDPLLDSRYLELELEQQITIPQEYPNRERSTRGRSAMRKHHKRQRNE